jgi:hypothetical protein
MQLAAYIHALQQRLHVKYRAPSLISYNMRVLHVVCAQEFENRFWTVLGFVGSTCVLFIPDSPFAIGQWSVSAGFICVALCTFGIHRYAYTYYTVL